MQVNWAIIDADNILLADSVKPLPETMLANCQLDPLDQNSLKFESKYKCFPS